MYKSSRSLSSRKQEKYQNKRNKSVNENENYSKFQQFQQSNSHQPYKQFMYMQEFFNTNLNEFPQDQEILEIQMNLTQISGSIHKKNWTADEKKVLVWVVGKLSQSKDLDIRDLPNYFWDEVSELICRRDPQQCKNKWQQMQKIDLQQKPFTQEEDKLLYSIINKYQEGEQGQKWSLIASELNCQSSNYRSSKQCRERWLNHLNPKIKRDPWNDDEDLLLLQYVEQFGRKWAEISKLFDGRRSENNVKNRFNSLIKREKDLTVNFQNEQEQTIEQILGNITVQNLTEQQLYAIDILKQKIQWRQGQIKQELQPFRRTSIVQDVEKHDKQVMKRSSQVKYSVGHLSDDETITEELTPCLVNVEKNLIYFCSKERILQFINKQIRQINVNLDKLSKEIRTFDSGINFKTQLSIISEINDSKFSSFICGINDNQENYSQISKVFNTNNCSNQNQDLDQYLNLESPSQHISKLLNPLEQIHYRAFNEVQKKYKSESILRKIPCINKIIPKSLPNVYLVHI